MQRTIQIARIGKWENFLDEEIIITKKHLKEIIRNFDNKIWEVGIPIFYKYSDRIVGRVEKLSIKNQKLYAVIKWTDNSQFKKRCNWITSEFNLDGKNGMALKSARAMNKLKVLKPIRKINLTKQ